VFRYQCRLENNCFVRVWSPIETEGKYLQKADSSEQPQKIHTIVLSIQQAEPLKATRCKEVARFTDTDATAPSMEGMSRLIQQEVMVKTLEEIILKNGQPALSCTAGSFLLFGMQAF